MQSITLYYREGSSDKIYQAYLEPKDGGWVVNYAYGRRESTLTTGTKTSTPVEKAKAEAIFGRLIAAKTNKGYTEIASGTPYTNGSAKLTAIRPQLLNPVPVEEVDRLLANDNYLVQPKLDGRRLLLLKRGDEVVGINRRGIECGFPASVGQAALCLQGDFLLDGEAMGDIFHVFDLLEKDGKDLREQSYTDRLTALLHLLASGSQESIKWVLTHRGAKMKTALFYKLREENAEGVVFKRANAPYRADRPALGGDQFKVKFVETASVVVSGINARRSAAIAVLEGNELMSAGNVTIPPDHPVPKVGQVAEVRYLYAMPDSGALVQPVYLGAREDIEPGECLRSQLKYKAAA